jgi:hypothetical protein
MSLRVARIKEGGGEKAFADSILWPAIGWLHIRRRDYQVSSEREDPGTNNATNKQKPKPTSNATERSSPK